ncbi:MAG: DNA-directed RNA polymerase subunit L [Candidatus Korarchaeum sp.]|jgi:DNA-directed RNA polymerase subunit L|nr:DNA-directed RNA polymerase subunit L [Candidatus Korarchaeum sp.]
MEIEVVNVSRNEIRVLIRGETHTLLSPLVEELNSLDGVEFAGYDVPHPLKEESILFLRVREGLNPREVLKGAIRELIRKYEVIENSFIEELSSLKVDH